MKAHQLNFDSAIVNIFGAVVVAWEEDRIITFRKEKEGGAYFIVYDCLTNRCVPFFVTERTEKALDFPKEYYEHALSELSKHRK